MIKFNVRKALKFLQSAKMSPAASVCCTGFSPQSCKERGHELKVLLAGRPFHFLHHSFLA